MRYRNNRGGVLEDILGLQDTFGSPWPQSLQVLENGRDLRTALFFWLVKKENNQTKNNLNFSSLSIYFFSLFEK